MVNYSRFVLENGLKVLIHEDHTTNLVAVNIVYNVGSRNEDENLTGMAHLFEHLMFGGSENIDDFDVPIQKAGGENNAFTNSDITNFYEVLPANNLDIALWLESDRMMKLNFNPKVLDVQKKVVIEEFKETCLNQPYGDVWHHMSKLAFKQHPYAWPTIGKRTEDIAKVEMEDIKSFYNKYYCPNNAVISICGDINTPEVLEKCRKWFESIPKSVVPEKKWLDEPCQNEERVSVVNSDVPTEALYLSFKMGDRLSHDFYHCDLISDILADGRSSRFYQNMIKEDQLCSSIDAYISGSFDPGLFVIEAKPSEGRTMKEVEDRIWQELEQLKTEKVNEQVISKLKNRLESSLRFSEVSILNKAMSLGYFETLKDASLINNQWEMYEHIDAESLMNTSNKIFRKDNSCKLSYIPN